MAAKKEFLPEPFITNQRQFQWELQASAGEGTGESFYVTSPAILTIGEYHLPARLMTSSGVGRAKASDVRLTVDFSQVAEDKRFELKQIFQDLGDTEDKVLEKDRIWHVTKGSTDNDLGLVRTVPTGIAQGQALPLAGRYPGVKFDEFVQALETIYNGDIRVEPATPTQRYLF